MTRPEPGFGAEERAAARRLLEWGLGEDHAAEDPTSRLALPPDARGSARMRSREPGVVAGLPCVPLAFEVMGVEVRVEDLVHDGDAVAPGDVLCRLEGPLRALLAAERTFLDLVAFLSGTATLTARFVAAAGPSCTVLDTRKTWPGARLLQKYAVRCGGGRNHRLHLADGILLKDNHRWAGLSLPQLVARARRRHPGLPVVVEVDGVGQLTEALAAGVDRVLLDNFTPSQVREAVALRDRSGNAVPLEVSGGVTLETVGDLARAGADMVSVGALTHSAPALDIALDRDAEGPR